MPEEILNINGNIKTIRTVSNINFIFNENGTMDMFIQFVKKIYLNEELLKYDPDGSIIVPFSELCQWPEFPATYEKIKVEAYSRRRLLD